MADFPAEELVTPALLAPIEATADAIPAEELAPLGGSTPAAVAYFLMRGRDSLAAYTTWVAPLADPNGAFATPINTTPPLVGAIVPGSGVILDTW